MWPLWGSPWGRAKVTAPSLYPLVTCPGASSPAAACFLDSYFPPPASITWDGPTPSAPRPFPALQWRRTGLYSAASAVLDLPGGAVPAQGLTCRARHAPSGTDLSARVTGQKVQSPRVELLQSCAFGEVQLACFAAGFAPPSASVDWLEDGVPLGLPAPPPQPEVGGTFRLDARLNVSLDDWSHKTYSCRVGHAPSGFEQEVTAQKCPDSPPEAAAVRIFLLPPSPAELYVSQSPRLRCLVTSLRSDDGLVVSWTRQPGAALRPLPLKLQPNVNGTFTATSEVPIAPGDWESGQVFTCEVRHQDLPAPRSKSLQRKSGRHPPSVFLLAPPAEEISGSRPTLSLTCFVRGFYPEDISVEWHKNNSPLAAGSYVTTQPIREQETASGGAAASYFLYSRLAVSRDEWERGATFVCMVVHEGLPMKFVQRSVSRTLEFDLPEELCSADPEEPDGPWDTIAVFITLFLLSVCYSATVTLFKVKWLLSTIIHLKRGHAPDYKNVIQHVV